MGFFLFKFEAFNVLLKRLFEKIAFVMTIYNTPSLSACCDSSGNSIIRHVFLDTKLVVLGLPKAYRINTANL